MHFAIILVGRLCKILKATDSGGSQQALLEPGSLWIGQWVIRVIESDLVVMLSYTNQQAITYSIATHQIYEVSMDHWYSPYH